ncbi:glycosyltransferase family 39 protein [Sphaerisporangium fuscum]|uniref:glycosyltransferase family 39 protein n=1 Tax=Sphaerisporangium fuscum TaxID=2835868 RepID=UPI001BDC8A09|nr:glycosyltransferase family 39 protein [Sphaerisporangium fuscum]
MAITREDTSAPGGLRRSPPPFAAGPVGAVAAVLAGLLTALSGRYGFHRDELYFLVAGDRPAWGYVDQPPLTPLLARASTAVFGVSPAGLRVVATLAAVAVVIVVVLTARELGGGRGAQFVAACSAACSAVVLVLGHLVATATFDTLAWVVVGWLVLRLLRTGDGRWYPVIGAAAGVALLNKYLIALLVAGLVVSLLAVGPRRVLRSRWLLAGVAVAALLAAPNLWWQAAHGWPQLTVAKGISENEGENRLLFVPLLVVQLSPLFVPIWVAGLVRLWRDPAVRWARAFAVAVPLLAVAVLVAGGKPYYVLPLVIVAMAAGAEPVVRWASGARRWALVAAFVVSAPMNVVVALPVLPPSALQAVNGINKEQGEQVGWPGMVSTVAGAWRRIPSERRGTAVIFTQNYGEAGAIARHGPALGLPGPYSGHMSYADWGPPPDSATGPVLLVHHRDALRLAGGLFTGCRVVASIDNGQGVDNEEQEAVVQLCEAPATPWSALWPRLRHF